MEPNPTSTSPKKASFSPSARATFTQMMRIGCPAEADGEGQQAQIVAHQRHVGRFQGLRGVADGDAHSGGGQRRRVVDAVAHHHHMAVLLAQLGHGRYLIFR
jgi:hypothetical protein